MAVDVESVHRHVARHAVRTHIACVVDHRHAVAGVGLAHAVGFGRIKTVAVAHNIVNLGLAKHFVHRHAHFVTAIGKHCVAHGLACAHAGLQLQGKMLARLRVGLHHSFERGGE